MPKGGIPDPVIAPRPAPALRFDITCPRCGCDVELVAPGTPGLNMTSAIVRCAGDCASHCARHASWLVRVTLDAA